MEVTLANFNAVLPEVLEGIHNCTFLSIDCELTGLKTTLNNVNAFDTPKQYYENALKDCREFLIIQYGITLFRMDDDAQKFRHKSYNFYTFRKPFRPYIQDQRFLCQSSSIEFLSNEGFDFNKLFKEGISYLNNVEEQNWREALEEQKKQVAVNKTKQGDIIEIPEEHRDFINEVIKSLEDFTASNETERVLPKCNAFVRRLIYQTTAERFGGKIELESRNVDKDRILYAMRVKSPEERQKIEQQKQDNLLQELDDYIGFSKVIRAIISSGKLVVGHNMLLDFMHTIDKFVTPLPESYSEFKDCAASLFSRVIDTKLLCKGEEFQNLIQSTVLGHLLQSVSEPPFNIPSCELEDGAQGYSIKDRKDHEAGYDSFITGLCFLAMVQYIGSHKGLTDLETFQQSTIDKLLHRCLNRIFLMILTDHQYVNLAGNDCKRLICTQRCYVPSRVLLRPVQPNFICQRFVNIFGRLYLQTTVTPSREHVFYLTFPKQWTTNNIVRLFSPFGGVYVAWLTDSSAYVGLFKRDQAALALKSLSQSDTYTIMTYARRQNQLNGQLAIVPSPMKRKKPQDVPAQSKRKRNEKAGGTSKPKRSFEPIEEEEGGEDIIEQPAIEKKTFSECEKWD